MAKSVLDIVIKLSKQGGADREIVTGLVKVKSALMSAASVAGSFVAAGYAIKQVLNQTVGKYVEYVAEIRRASDATGMTAEETSRLVQVLDDVKIEYGELEKVIQKNAKLYDYSTEGLASMSSQYLSITSATERAAYMQERFGKAWVSFVPLMQLGGDSIRDMSAGIADGLVITDKAEQQAREYEIAVDNLSDTWTAYTNQVGARFVPALTRMAVSMQRSTEMTHKQWMGIALLDKSLEQGTITQAEYAAGLEELGLNTDSAVSATDSATQSYTAWARSISTAADANADLLESQEALWKNEVDTLIGNINSMQTASEQYAEAVAGLDEQLASGMITNDEYAAGMKAAAAAHEAATNQITFDLARMQLASDGWQQADTTAILAIGESLNIFSGAERSAAEESIKNTQAIAEAYVGLSGVSTAQTPIVSEALEELTGQLNNGKITTQAYREKVIALYEQIEKLDGASATAVVNLIVHGSIPNGFTPANQVEGHTYAGRASGGPLEDITMVGEKGYELVVRGSDGAYTVIPHEAAAWMVHAGMVPDQYMAGGGRVGYVPPKRNPRDDNPVISAVTGAADVVMGGPSNPQVPIDLDVASSNAAIAQSQQDNANINAQMMAISQQGNRDVAKELQRLNDQMRSFRSELPVAVASAVQRSI